MSQTEDHENNSISDSQSSENEEQNLVADAESVDEYITSDSDDEYEPLLQPQTNSGEKSPVSPLPSETSSLSTDRIENYISNGSHDMQIHIQNQSTPPGRDAFSVLMDSPARKSQPPASYKKITPRKRLFESSPSAVALQIGNRGIEEEETPPLPVKRPKITSLDGLDNFSANIVSYHRIDEQVAMKILGQYSTLQIKPKEGDQQALIRCIVEKCNKDLQDVHKTATLYEELLETEEVEMESLPLQVIIQSPEDQNNESPSRCETQRGSPTLSASNEESVIQYTDHDDHEFKILIYCQNVTGNDKLLQFYGFQKFISKVSLLIFYFRKTDIFVITTRHAWKSIQWACDYSFSRRIAARLLNEDGKIKSTDKLLLGNTRVLTQSKKKHEGENSLSVFSTNYTAEFRKNASIYRLSCFQTVEAKQRKTQMDVGFAYIRINKKIHPKHYSEMFEHLSKICNGQNTETIDDPPTQELDSTAHARNLIRVPDSYLSETLELIIIKNIKNACRNSGRDKLKKYDICHKHTEDFCLATDFKLSYNSDIIARYSEIPSLMDIVESLRASKVNRCENLIKATNEHKFYKIFQTIKLSYKIRDTQTKPESIMNYIEGEEVHEGRNYFRILGKWSLVLDEYFIKVHQMFMGLLKKHFICEENPGHLQRKWKEDQSVIDYINMYRDTENYIFPGASETKLFDLAQVTSEGKIYFYWISKNFDGRIRDTSTQIFNSTKILMQRNEPELRKLYESNFVLQEHFPNYEDFVEALKKNATFVFCVFSGQEETLRREKELESTLTTEDISNFLTEDHELQVELGNFFKIVRPPRNEKENRETFLSRISDNVLARMRVKDFIDPNGEVKRKLVLCKRMDDFIDCLDLENRDCLTRFYEFLESRHFSKYPSFMPKLEVSATKTGVTSLNCDFNICEILQE